MRDRRYRAVSPVSDFSISQKIRVALIEDGHTDLAVESITQPIRELEAAHGELTKRVRALEQEKVNWQTESTVLKIITKAGYRKDSRKLHWILAAAGTLTVGLAGALIDRYVGKH